MTGDDHNLGGTSGRFDQYLDDSPAGCSVANWTRARWYLIRVGEHADSELPIVRFSGTLK